MTIPLTRRTVCLAAATLAAPGVANAQTYPNRPVRVVVPYPAGGGADTVSRILFQQLSADFGQTFVIDNRGGAGGTLGAAAVASADPDGYTILFDATAHSANPTLFARLPYDTLTAFRPVFHAAVVPNLLVVNPQVADLTVADVIATGKATTGGLSWASSGNGSAQHLALELFRSMAGLTINHIPYRGGGPALADLISGQVRYFFSNASSSVGHVRSGALRAIAHTSRSPIDLMPGLPAVADTLPGYEALEWNGVFVPARTPDAVVQRLNEGLNAVIRQPAIRARFGELAVATRANTPDEFGAFVRAEIGKWGDVIRQAGIRVE